MVVGIELKTSEKATSALKCWAFSLALLEYIYNCYFEIIILHIDYVVSLKETLP